MIWGTFLHLKKWCIAIILLHQLFTYYNHFLAEHVALTALLMFVFAKPMGRLK